MYIMVKKEEYERLIRENAELKQQVKELIAENTALKNQISVLINENIELKAQLKNALEQIKLLTAQKWGKSSEKLNVEQNTFNEAEVLSDSSGELVEVEIEQISGYLRKKKKKSRKKKLECFPVEVIEYYLPEGECSCPNCNTGTLHIMKKEIRRELAYEPATFKVIEHVSHVYSCRNCNDYEENATIIKADSPTALIPKSIASASLVAYVLYEKYVMATPLYRLENHFEKDDIELSRQVLASWVIKVANNHLIKIYNFMKEILLKKDVLYSDDTEVRVLKEPGRKATTKSYMWVYISVMEENIFLFEYTETRARNNIEAFLKGFNGFIHVDGYVGYENILGAILVGCFAHARRKFMESIKVIPKENRTANVASVIGLNYCNELFKNERMIVEKIIHEFGEDFDRYDKNVVDRIFKLRKELSQPVLDKMKEWLDSIESKVVPNSYLGKAVTYCLNQWDKLIRFMCDGRLEISNNLSERTIKNFVIGRKNWLFSDTPSGAKASAIVYSIVETAKANNLNVYKYFKYILEKLPNISDDKISELLPWSDCLPEDIKVNSRDKPSSEIL